MTTKNSQDIIESLRDTQEAGVLAYRTFVQCFTSTLIVTIPGALALDRSALVGVLASGAVSAAAAGLSRAQTFLRRRWAE